MKNNYEHKIVELLRSENSRERNKGFQLMIDAFYSKVVSWVKKQAGNIHHDDVWQDAATLMYLAIRKGKYQVQENAQMYTYFHTIVKSTWLGYYHQIDKNDSFNDSHLNLQIEEKYRQPDIVTELKEHKHFLEYCMNLLDERARLLIKAIFFEGKKINEIFEELGLRTANNAKQKLFATKLKLQECLKKKTGYGK